MRTQEYWKPDEEIMKEYNRRIFEPLWSKDEQGSKEIEDSKEEEERKEGRKEGRKGVSRKLSSATHAR